MQKALGLLPDAVAEPMMKNAGVDRLAALCTAIDAVRRGGTVSISGVYGGAADPMPMMQLFDKQIQLRMGQANVRRWTDEMLAAARQDDDPLGVEAFATHHLPLDEAPEAYAQLPGEGGRHGEGGLQALTISFRAGLVRRRAPRTQPTISAVVGAPGVKTGATPELLERRDVVVGDDAAAEDHDVAPRRAREQRDHPREQRHVRAGQDGQPDRVGVLLDRGLHDLLGRLVQPGVDDLHASVAQRARDHLGAPVVPIEPRLCDHDPDPAVALGALWWQAIRDVGILATPSRGATPKGVYPGLTGA